MNRPLALAALMSLTLSAATGCGAKKEPGDGASSGTREDLRLDPRLLPQRRPRRHLRGAGERASTTAPG